jgi:hypothetical protein
MNRKRLLAAEEQRKAALQALFQAMLHQLMTGQVRVPGVAVGGCWMTQHQRS